MSRIASTQVLIEELKAIQKPNYIPTNSDWGICGNIKEVLLHCKEEDADKNFLAGEMLSSTVHYYARLNGRDITYPIENGAQEYFDNKEKWKGEWYAKRMRLAEKLVKFLETGDEQQLKGEL